MIKVIIIFIMSPSIAYAYIDPGAGMLLIQGLIAAAGGVLVFLRNPVKKIIAVFRHIFRRGI